jgi:hypothetical protein
MSMFMILRYKLRMTADPQKIGWASSNQTNPRFIFTQSKAKNAYKPQRRGRAVASGKAVSPMNRFSKPPFSRLVLAGLTLTVGRVWQLDDGAAGCGGGVGEVSWYHVLVPYTPIGSLKNDRVRWGQDTRGRWTHSSSASQFSKTPAS